MVHYHDPSTWKVEAKNDLRSVRTTERSYLKNSNGGTGMLKKEIKGENPNGINSLSRMEELVLKQSKQWKSKILHSTLREVNFDHPASASVHRTGLTILPL